MVDGALSVNGKVEALDEMYRIVVRVAYMLIQGFVEELIKTKGTYQDSLLSMLFRVVIIIVFVLVVVIIKTFPNQLSP